MLPVLLMRQPRSNEFFGGVKQLSPTPRKLPDRYAGLALQHPCSTHFVTQFFNCRIELIDSVSVRLDGFIHDHQEINRHEDRKPVTGQELFEQFH